jgi:hypothetical protein
VPVTGIGSFIKFVFTKAPSKSGKNPNGQVGLICLRFWAQPLGEYNGAKNEATPIRSGEPDTLDRVLIELGLPVENVKWSSLENDSYAYAPVDEDTRETILDMEKNRDNAYKT